MYAKFLVFLQTKGPSILTALIILAAGWLVIKLLLKLLKKGMEKSRLEKTCHKFILTLSKYSLYLLLAIIVLSKLGVDMTSIITILGVGGLAVSLAVKDSLSNVAGGFILLFSKPFKVGDFIEFDGMKGTVQQISILQTKLLTFDNKAVFVPNGQISSAKIINYSAEENRLLVLPLSIGYEADFDNVREVLLRVLQNNEKVLPDPPPITVISDYSDSAIKISAKAWVKNSDFWDANYALMEEIKLAFAENEISFPYNHLDVHISRESCPEK